MHGDAHPGNVFWHPETGVTFIDTPNCHFSMDAAGGPIGSPARDVSNMVQRLARFGGEAGLPGGEIAGLQSTFLDAYRAAGGPPLSAPARAAFATRFAVRDVLNTLNLLREADTEELESSLREQLTYEIAFLKAALGWES